MGEILITFIKQSAAFNLKKVAKRAGLSVQIVQTPKEISDKGCSYAIAAKRTDMGKLIHLSREYNIEYRRVFAIYVSPEGKNVYSQI